MTAADDDHLVGNFLEEGRHAIVAVVVTCNRVDHLDRIHKRWQHIDDLRDLLLLLLDTTVVPKVITIWD